MRLIVFIIGLFISPVIIGQIVFERTKHDFGDLESYSDRFVDVLVTNKGLKKEYILSVRKPADVVYIVNGQFIEKDSSLIVRLQVNPKSKGRFSYDIDISTSDRELPTNIKLTGNLKDLPSDDLSAFTACPNFSARPSHNRSNDFDLTVITIDKQTRETLAKSSVTMIQNGQAVWALTTDKNGKIKEDCTLGMSYFYATHDNYLPAEMGAYVNVQRKTVVIELEKDQSIALPTINTNDSIVTQILEEPIVLVDEKLKEQLNNEQATESKIEVPVLMASLDKDDFSDEHFKPINVVFVLDVSSSMNDGDKLELMKYSLSQLVEMLRPQDKMGIVTYASETQVLLAPTSGDEKEKMNAQVAELKANGMTAGGAGIKLGYQQVLKEFSSGGVNQIIVITDGAFNRNSDDYKKYIKKYSKKGIQMSVVGVKNKDVDEKEMREAAELGGGHYIPIFKLVDAENNLKEEIRVSTFKN